MRYLVVYCHPVETSFSAALHRAVITGLQKAGHEVIDLDLYAEEFEPALSRQERTDYFDPTHNAAAVSRYTQQLADVSAIAFVYPSWWYGMPAMLKGYFDRVWLPGVAFDLDDRGNLTMTRLKHIRRIVVVTTYGSPWWHIRLYMGNPARKLFNRGIRRLFGRGCRINWHVCYDMDHMTQPRRAAFLHRVMTKCSQPD
jgi:NAD(P)H dehydrogenase (quinone)